MMMEAVHLASHNDVQMSQGASADRSSFCMRANHMKPSLRLQNHDTSPLALERGTIELQTALATVAAMESASSATNQVYTSIATRSHVPDEHISLQARTVELWREEQSLSECTRFPCYHQCI